MHEHFRGRFLSSQTTNVGLDLVAIALKQGRDHGQPDYNTIRRKCGLTKVFIIINDLINFLYFRCMVLMN